MVLALLLLAPPGRYGFEAAVLPLRRGAEKEADLREKVGLRSREEETCDVDAGMPVADKD